VDGLQKAPPLSVISWILLFCCYSSKLERCELQLKSVNLLLSVAISARDRLIWRAVFIISGKVTIFTLNTSGASQNWLSIAVTLTTQPLVNCWYDGLQYAISFHFKHCCAGFCHSSAGWAQKNFEKWSNNPTTIDSAAGEISLSFLKLLQNMILSQSSFSEDKTRSIICKHCM
jgi:hypothetical protein